MRSLRTIIATFLFYGYVVVSALVAWSIFLAASPWVWIFDRDHRRLLNRITATSAFQRVAVPPMWRSEWEGREDVVVPVRVRPGPLGCDSSSDGRGPRRAAPGRGFRGHDRGLPEEPGPRA